MKKNDMTFKFMGKKYRVRRGGNLHLMIELGLPLLGVIIMYALICMAITYENTCML